MNSYVRLDHVDPEHARTFVVNWCVTSVCNYACSYCLESLHDHRFRFPEVETVLGLLRQVREQRPGHRIAFEMTGGEVTAWPRFLECAEGLRQGGALVSILSNGSRPLEWWRKAAPLLDEVVLSYHTEFSRFDHFLEVVDLLRRSVPLHVNIIMNPRLFSQCLTAGRILAGLQDVTLCFQPLVQDLEKTDSPLYDYTAEQLALLENPGRILPSPVLTRPRKAQRGCLALTDRTGRQTILAAQAFAAAGLNRWRGWSCDMGLEQLVVYLDGSVYGGWCRQGPRMGNVNEGPIVLSREPVVCQSDSCGCYFDIQCSKRWTPQAERGPSIPEPRLAQRSAGT
jgi:organic radical activating enzyme